jgi:hypothetical protein
MNKKEIIRKLIENIKKEIELKSSNHYPSDADWHIGFRFGDDNLTANESEYDPKTGKIINNTKVGSRATYLQQWDTEPEGYFENKDVKRDNGIGLVSLVMQQLNPIK